MQAWWAEETSLKNIKNLYCSKTSVNTHTQDIYKMKTINLHKNYTKMKTIIYIPIVGSYILRYKSSIIQMQFSTEKKVLHKIHNNYCIIIFTVYFMDLRIRDMKLFFWFNELTIR